jgi:hypothetical protein
MKKLLVVMVCAGAMALVGCGDKETPENFGKKYIEKKFENINCDLMDLDYSISDETEDSATVTIEGKIKYKEELHLVKKNGEWVVGEKPVKKEAAVKEEAKEETHAVPAKEEEHEAPPATHEAPVAEDAHAPAAHH